MPFASPSLSHFLSLSLSLTPFLCHYSSVRDAYKHNGSFCWSTVADSLSRAAETYLTHPHTDPAAQTSFNTVQNRPNKPSFYSQRKKAWNEVLLITVPFHNPQCHIPQHILKRQGRTTRGYESSLILTQEPKGGEDDKDLHKAVRGCGRLSWCRHLCHIR